MLIVVVPTLVHEYLHRELYNRCVYRIMELGLDLAWLSLGSATYRKQEGHPGGDGSEGDSTGRPTKRDDGSIWPTLVIEAGYSETLAELHDDMAWWFHASDHAVKIVILAKFDHARGRIILQKWEEDTPRRPGATMTRRAPALEPVLRQDIQITRNTATTPPTFDVARGALVLGFELLFLRIPGPQEGDVVISVEVLQRFAESSWMLVHD